MGTDTGVRARASAVVASAVLALGTTGCGTSTPGPSGTSAEPSREHRATVRPLPSDTDRPSHTTGSTPGRRPSTNGGATTSPAVTYRTYVNPRFGFRLAVPADYVEQPPPEDGDGQEFRSPDHRVSVTAFGANNLGDTPKTVLAECRRGAAATKGRTTYTANEGHAVTCSGYTRDGAIFYQHTLVYSAVEYTIEWTYPQDRKDALDGPVRTSVKTFEPGTDQSH